MKLIEIKITHNNNSETIHHKLFVNEDDEMIKTIIQYFTKYAKDYSYYEIHNNDLLNELVRKRIKIIKTELQALFDEGEKLEKYLQDNS